MKKMHLLSVLVIILILTGCSDNKSENATESSIEMMDTAVSAEKTSVENERVNPLMETEGEEQILHSERKVIYQADLSLEVQDFEDAILLIQEQLTKRQGYIVESNRYQSGEADIYGTMVVKVPNEDFNSFLDEVENVGISLLERRIAGTDVTEEYIDLEARLRSKQAVEERLFLFLENASATEDLLKISKDLASIQQEIEQIKGRMHYLDNNVNYATVTINLHEKTINISTLHNTENFNTWIKAKSLFMSTINGLLSFFSSLIVLTIGLSPLLLALLLAIIFIVVAKRRKWKTLDRKQKANSKEDPS